MAGLVEELRAASQEDGMRVGLATVALEEAERALAGARLRAEATSDALSALEERLKVLTPPPPGQDEARRAEEGATVDELILGFLAGREKAPTWEIVEHVRGIRPDADPGKVSPRLTQLKKADRIVHVTTGWWRIARTADGKSAGAEDAGEEGARP
ncbi:hypothetical protein [Streptomyces ehimensis]|uniref:HTH HARE-type domain-containing protein n=1 Tax=Streptomyces ehimensis TaxID=68195 RepID=A0ABV9BTI8_9ACTN